MATKKIDEEKTLKYAVAFYFCTSGKVNFMLGNKMYQHIDTVYDQREDGRGFNTCEVVINNFTGIEASAIFSLVINSIYMLIHFIA